VGDIGGTNTRLALFDPGSGALSAVRNYLNRDYGSLEEIIAEWLAELKDTAPGDCCLAVAAPPFEDRVSMLNIDWSFSISEIADRFGFRRMRCVNDFEGNAYALSQLGDEDLVALRPGTPRCRRFAVVGPGTGLGGATLEYCLDTPVAGASEPGHMGLAPATALEFELFRALLPAHGEVHAELLLSGPGLARLYHTLGEVRGEPAPLAQPPEISAAALSGDAPLAREAVGAFCALLGSICGDYVLATGSYGGLYLAGGIVPDILPILRESAFVTRFDNKGDMSPQLREVPLHAIVSPGTGLLGAAHVPF